MSIKARQTGEQIDADLSRINAAQDAEHNGKVIYIRHGELDYDTYTNLFTVVSLPANEG